MEKGQTQRKVYLPEQMTMVTYRNQQFSTEIMEKGEHAIIIPEDEVVFFIRHDHCIIIGKPAMNTSEVDLDDVELLGDGKEYRQYLDDGYTKNASMDNTRLCSRTTA